MKVFVADVRSLCDPVYWERGLKKVGPERREACLACKAREDGARRLGAGLLLVLALQEAGLSERPLGESTKGQAVKAPVAFAPVVGRMPGGKPYFPRFPQIHFNLSHSGGMAACVLAEVPVGIDIQQIRPVRPGLAERFFHPMEQKLLAAAGDGQGKEDMFFRYWCAKESYIKYTGLGMRQPLQQFYADLEGEKIRCRDAVISRQREQSAAAYPQKERKRFGEQDKKLAELRSFSVGPDYRLAVCAKAGTDMPAAYSMVNLVALLEDG